MQSGRELGDWALQINLSFIPFASSPRSRCVCVYTCEYTECIVCVCAPYVQDDGRHSQVQNDVITKNLRMIRIQKTLAVRALPKVASREMCHVCICVYMYHMYTYMY